MSLELCCVTHPKLLSHLYIAKKEAFDWQAEIPTWDASLQNENGKNSQRNHHHNNKTQNMTGF